MHKPRLPLHETVPARHDLQVVKAQIHTQRAGEDPNVLRDGRSTGGRAKKISGMSSADSLELVMILDEKGEHILSDKPKSRLIQRALGRIQTIIIYLLYTIPKIILREMKF